jgi:hypothetical protein
MRIGLFGGTFDPPHDAHLAACLLAMKRIGLDRVWWLVTPGNPLKDTRGLAPLKERVAARALANPRFDVMTSKPASAPATPTRPSPICASTVRVCASSGSWAPTICAASIAGRNGAGSPP